MWMAEASVAEARATNHAILLGLALAVATCPIALWIGDLPVAEHYVTMLLDHSTGHGLERWNNFDRMYHAELVIHGGGIDTGLPLLRASLAEPAAVGFAPRYFTSLMAMALGQAGQVAVGLRAIEDADRPIGAH